MTPSLGKKAVTGTLWIAGSTYANFLVNFVAQILLMRLLAPEAFGVVALAMFFTVLAKKLGGFGFNQALIHQQQDLETAVPTHLFCHLAVSGAALALILIFAPMIASGYGRGVSTALIALAVLSVFEDASHTPRIMLEKELVFGRVAVLNTTTTLISSVCAVVLAWAGFGMWALVARYGVSVVIGCFWYWLWSPVRFRFRPHWGTIRWFVRFGGYLWIAGMSTFLILELDDFLVGTLVGAVELGFYNRAYRFACLPTDLVGHVISRVAFPLYSKLQGDRERLSVTFRMILRAIFTVTAPLALILVIVAREFTLILFGERWLPMVPLLRLLVVYAALRPVFDMSGELFVAVGRPRETGRILLVQAAALVVICPPLTHRFEAAGAAVSVGAVMVLGVLLAFHRVRTSVDVRYREVLLAPSVSALAATAATLLAARALPMQSAALGLVFKTLVFAAAYLGTLLPVKWSVLRQEMGFVLSRLREPPDAVPREEPGLGEKIP